MRFCDFFLDYKLNVCNLKSTIKWNKLPVYRRFFILLLFIIGVATIASAFLRLYNLTFVFYFILVFILLSVFIIDARKANQKEMLEKHYKVYSFNRMAAFGKLLEKYSISLNDEKKLLLLKEQAKISQDKYSIVSSLKKPFKTLFTIIIPIVTYIATVIAKSTTAEDLIILGLQVIVIIICVAAIILAISPYLNNLIDRDYKRYGDLMYDIDQVILFGIRKK